MDKTCLLILDVASKVDPSSSFSFSTRRVKSGDHQVWQIALVQDRGDRSGTFMYAQGEGETLETAAKALLERFRVVVNKRHMDVVEAGAKAAQRHEAEKTTLWEALEQLHESDEV